MPYDMTTFTGQRIDPLRLEPKDISIRDIAHSLSLLCRFGGHTKEFYSVAQHSIRVSELCPDELKLEGLLHDASEAYIQDLIRPVKHSIPFYNVLESQVWRVIAKRYKLNPELSSIVEEADNAVLKSEIVQFLKNGHQEIARSSHWADLPPVKPVKYAWVSTHVETLFLKKYSELYNRHVGNPSKSDLR